MMLCKLINMFFMQRDSIGKEELREPIVTIDSEFIFIMKERKAIFVKVL